MARSGPSESFHVLELKKRVRLKDFGVRTTESLGKTQMLMGKRKGNKNASDTLHSVSDI